MYVCVLVTGSPTTLRFAAGFTHLPLHHVCHLVCNDQQSKWVPCCLSPLLQLSSVAFGCMLSCDYTHCFLSISVFADYLLQHFDHTGEFSMACCRNKSCFLLIVSTPSLSQGAWSASPKWVATMGKLVVTVGLVFSTRSHLRSIYRLYYKCIFTIHIELEFTFIWKMQVIHVTLSLSPSRYTAVITLIGNSCLFYVAKLTN